MRLWFCVIPSPCVTDILARINVIWDNARDVWVVGFFLSDVEVMIENAVDGYSNLASTVRNRPLRAARPSKPEGSSTSHVWISWLIIDASMQLDGVGMRLYQIVSSGIIICDCLDGVQWQCMSQKYMSLQSMSWIGVNVRKYSAQIRVQR